MVGRLIATVGIALCLSSPLAYGQESNSRPDCDQKISVYVKEKCADFNAVETLFEFREFDRNFTKLHHCLLNFQTQACAESEKVCIKNNLLYSSVRSIGELIDRFTNLEPICTIEYSVQLYLLMQQLRSTNDVKLLRVLESISNLVSQRCRESLASRLIYVEQKAPDSVKHNNLILGLLGLNPSFLDKIDEVDETSYVPILERELTESHQGSVAISKSGYEFELQVKQALDAIRISCNTLKSYHVNILGSLGLLASIGIGIYNELESAVSENQNSKAKIQQWVMSAITCQSLRSVVKLSKTTIEGDLINTIKILAIQEADVSLLDEFDTTYSTYGLPEVKTSIDLSLKFNDKAHTINSKIITKDRKMELLRGPSYRLSRAIFDYLDLTQKRRDDIPYALLNI